MPLKLVSAVLLVEELLWTVSCPVDDPGTVGSNCTSNVTAKPGFKVTGKVAADIVKAVPLTTPELTVTGVVPVEVSVTGCVTVVLTVILPNAILAGLTVSVGTAALSCRAKVWLMPPALAVSVAACAEVTGETDAVNVVPRAFAGTVTVAGTVTAALLLPRFTLTGPLAATVISTLQTSLPEPVKEELVQENALNAGGGSARTSKIRLTGDFCAALGFRIPTVTVLVPAGRLMVLCSSVEETKMVATSTPEVSNCEPETKSEPRTSSKKLLPGSTCVMEPETNTGSGLRTFTLSVAEAAGVDSVLTLTVTECPAQIVAAGE